MTTTPAERGATFRDYAAAEVRAHMGRQRLSARALALAVGESHTWATRRVNGAVPMTTDDLERIAGVLGMSPIDLLTGQSRPPSSPGPIGVDGGSTTHRYVARKRHLIAVDSLLDAPPSPSACPATARLEVDDDLSLDRRGARSPSAPGRSARPLTTAVPA